MKKIMVFENVNLSAPDVDDYDDNDDDDDDDENREKEIRDCVGDEESIPANSHALGVSLTPAS